MSLWQHRIRIQKKRKVCQLQFISSCCLGTSGLRIEAINTLIPPFSLRKIHSNSKSIPFHLCASGHFSSGCFRVDLKAIHFRSSGFLGFLWASVFYVHKTSLGFYVHKIPLWLITSTAVRIVLRNVHRKTDTSPSSPSLGGIPEGYSVALWVASEEKQKSFFFMKKDWASVFPGLFLPFLFLLPAIINCLSQLQQVL